MPFLLVILTHSVKEYFRLDKYQQMRRTPAQVMK
jgi:hypothetical protein